MARGQGASEYMCGAEIGVELARAMTARARGDLAVPVLATTDVHEHSHMRCNSWENRSGRLWTVLERVHCGRRVRLPATLHLGRVLTRRRRGRTRDHSTQRPEGRPESDGKRTES
jgi:hypothetical protein